VWAELAELAKLADVQMCSCAYACARAAAAAADDDDDLMMMMMMTICFPCLDFILISMSTCNGTSVQGRPCVQKKPFTQSTCGQSIVQEDEVDADDEDADSGERDGQLGMSLRSARVL
jgi:hypothetical protein